MSKMKLLYPKKTPPEAPRRRGVEKPEFIQGVIEFPEPLNDDIKHAEGFTGGRMNLDTWRKINKKH